MGTQSIYTNGFQIPHLKKKKNRVSSGFVRVPGQPAGSPGCGRAVAAAGLLLNPDRSSHRVDPPGRAGFNNSGNNCSNRLCCLCGRLILVGLVCFCVLKMFLKKNNFLYFFLCFKLMCFFFVFLDYFADIKNNFFFKKYFFLIHFYIKSILKNNDNHFSKQTLSWLHSTINSYLLCLFYCVQEAQSAAANNSQALDIGDDISVVGGR